MSMCHVSCATRSCHVVMGYRSYSIAQSCGQVSRCPLSDEQCHTLIRRPYPCHVICHVSCVICQVSQNHVSGSCQGLHMSHLFKVCVICPMSRWFMSRHQVIHVSCGVIKSWSCVMSCVICHLSCAMLCGQSWFCIHLEESKRFFRTFILGDKRLRLFRARASGSRSV
jgi:hypothetical protein